MSKNTVERTDASHVVSMKAKFDVDIPKGSAVVISNDYEVAPYDTQTDFAQGVALEAHASGVYDCIPVLLAGPVIRVLAGIAITYGNTVTGNAAVAGEWIVDADDPAGFALESADDGDEFDMCFIGEQY